MLPKIGLELPSGNAVVNEAIRKDDLELVKYILCTEKKFIDDELARRHMKIVNHLHILCGKNVDAASRYGRLEIVQYLHSIGQECSSTSINYAIQYGFLDIVRYLHEVAGVGCDGMGIVEASSQGYLGIVKYLHPKIADKSYINLAMDRASMFGHLDIVKYLYKVAEAKCTSNAMTSASQFGHLDVVKYLYEDVELCPIEYSEAIKRARDNGYPEVVKYLTIRSHSSKTNLKT